MTRSTIWMIERTVEYEGNNGPYAEEHVDPDLGWFPTKELADEAIEKIQAPLHTAYQEALVKYQADVDEARAKSQQAREQGFEYPAHKWPRHPRNAPDDLAAVEVQPGNEEES